MNTARLNQGTPLLLNAVSKHYAENIVLNQLDLHIPAGQFVAVVGRSGGGKSTLLRLLAGLETPTAGDVLAGTTPLAEIQEDTRMMFQDARLLPWKSVIDNVGLGLKGQWRDAARRALAAVGLENRAREWPAALSGGQKQRVALARALAVEPQILLLDEPFGALDAQVRKELRRWLRQLHEELKFTSVFVTHDQEEATEVADRVVVMSQGNIEQADAPDQVWREPATRFVLEFMGEVNRLQGTIRGGQFHVGAHRWPLGYTPAYQGPVDLFLRPWEVDISRRTSLDSPLPVQVLEASPKGHYTQLVVQPLGWYNEALTVVMHGDDAPQRGERLFVGLQHARLYNGDERIETRDEELALAQSA